jgi:hypothetical protein
MFSHDTPLPDLIPVNVSKLENHYILREKSVAKISPRLSYPEVQAGRILIVKKGYGRQLVSSSIL